MKFCSRPFEHMYITPDGRVRVCGWTKGSIGNLIEEDIDDIWNGEKAERQRDAIRNGSFSFCRKESCPSLENDLLPDLSEEEFAKSAKKSENPKDLNVACDWVCNHSCPSCRDEVFVGDECYDSNVKLMLEKLAPYMEKAETINTDGNGDVFASPAIMNMLEKFHPKHPECVISLETNGVLFDEEHWSRISHLSRYNVAVTVTPNSFEEGTYKYLNGGHDTYQSIMKNLKFISQLRKNEEIKVLNISMVVSERNCFEVPSFAKRAIEEFNPDKVLIKPIYKWFALKEDDYWFKDVLNPLHPYHKEYLEVLKNPILDHEKVFLWGGRNIHKPSKHPAYQYKDQLAFIIECLQENDAKTKIKNYFESRGVNKIYIYGDEVMTPFTYKFLKEIISVNGIIARDCCHQDIIGEAIIRLDDYEPKDEDNILIINYAFRDAIRMDVDVKGFAGQYIGLDEIMNVVCN